MKIVCISAAQIPSDTANSIQVMKVCQAFRQLGHAVTLFVPGCKPSADSSLQLQSHYGLEVTFPIQWLEVRNRRLFSLGKLSGGRAAWTPTLLYAWPLQSAVLGLLFGKPSMLELHDIPHRALWSALAAPFS
jgi:hypothetical protein